jgi:hypothetical protein
MKFGVSEVEIARGIEKLQGAINDAKRCFGNDQEKHLPRRGFVTLLYPDIELIGFYWYHEKHIKDFFSEIGKFLKTFYRILRYLHKMLFLLWRSCSFRESKSTIFFCRRFGTFKQLFTVSPDFVYLRSCVGFSYLTEIVDALAPYQLGSSSIGVR